MSRKVFVSFIIILLVTSILVGITAYRCGSHQKQTQKVYVYLGGLHEDSVGLTFAMRNMDLLVFLKEGDLVTLNFLDFSGVNKHALISVQEINQRSAKIIVVQKSYRQHDFGDVIGWIKVEERSTVVIVKEVYDIIFEGEYVGNPSINWRCLSENHPIRTW